MRLTKRQRRVLNGASRDRLSFASRCRAVFAVAGRDYTALASPPRYGGEEGPAVVLEVVVFARLSRRMLYRGCRLDWEVTADEEAETMLGFVGEVAAMKVRGNRTEILAATPSYWAEKTPLGRTLDFPNTRPSDALFEAAGTLPYPDIDIPLTERPKVRRTGPDSFQWTSTVSDVYEAVREETGLALIDTPLGVATGRRSVAVHASSASRWTFTEGLDFPDGELEVSESPVVIERTEAEEAGGRYARVVAYRESEEGVHTRVAEAEVDNGDEPVPRRSELLVPIDSEDNEDPQATVVRIARRLGENTHALGFPVIYPPFFLSRFDPVTVIGREITRAGVWRETYRARLTAVSCDGKRGTCRAVGSPIARQFVPARARRNRNRLPRSAALAKDWLGRP